MFVALRLLTALALLGTNQGFGSTIFPTGVAYGNWADESDEARVAYASGS